MHGGAFGMHINCLRKGWCGEYGMVAQSKYGRTS